MSDKDVSDVLNVSTLGYTGYSGRKEEKKAAKEAESEKQRARERLAPLPDPELLKTQQRKKTVKQRTRRGGRVSTILSQDKETLG